MIGSIIGKKILFFAPVFTATFFQTPKMAGVVGPSDNTFSSLLDSGLEPDRSLYSELLMKNRLLLTKELTVDEKILGYLSQSGVLGSQVKNDIDTKVTRAQKTQVNYHFYMVIMVIISMGEAEW